MPAFNELSAAERVIVVMIGAIAAVGSLVGLFFLVVMVREGGKGPDLREAGPSRMDLERISATDLRVGDVVQFQFSNVSPEIPGTVKSVGPGRGARRLSDRRIELEDGRSWEVDMFTAVFRKRGA